MSVHSLLADMGLEFSDSYPKPTDDAPLWINLFAECYGLDVELFHILTWLRCVGANLEKTNIKEMPYKITPIIGPENWSSIDEWEKEKQHLVPHVDNLLKALKRL